MRLESIEFPYEGKAYLKVSARPYSGVNVESPYALEVTRVGDDAPAAASEKPAAASGKAAPVPAPDTAPVQPSTSTSGAPGVTVIVGLGVGVLIAARLTCSAGRSRRLTSGTGVRQGG